MSESELSELERLRKENLALKNQLSDNGEITLKVGEKGGVVVGIGSRFPVTLYENQWRKILANKEKIIDFMDENIDKLAKK